MAKIYSKKAVATNTMLPKKETVNLILNYSKALKVIQVGTVNFKVMAN